MNKSFKIGSRTISANSPAFIVAEISANHNQDYDRAVEIIHAAKEAGADAVKLQTYTADSITLDCDDECFQINEGTIWDGTTLYKLYQEAYTPWDWQPKLKEEANRLGLECFSSPFDLTSVDFLVKMDVPAYKIASYEINDIPMIRKIARLHKPMIFATGAGAASRVALGTAVVFGMAINAVVGTLFVPGFWELLQSFKEKYLGRLFASSTQLSDAKPETPEKKQDTSL